MRRFLVMLAVMGLLTSMLASSVAARPSSGNITIRQFDGRVVQGSKSASGQLAQSDPDLLARNDRQVINIIVKMDVDALASYTGDLAGLRATSPGSTGAPLRAGDVAVVAYQRFLNHEAATIRLAAQRAVPAIKLGRNFLIAYGGFAAQIPANKAKELLRVPGISAVQLDKVNHPTANSSPDFVGAPAVWSTLGGESKAGKGVKVGILDTGIWPEHPMLVDPGIPFPGGGPYGCEFGESTNINDPSFSCNDKMLGAYAFMNTNMFVNALGADEYCNPGMTDVDHPDGTCSARDADGHGTHTSTTAAGSPVDHAVVNGTDYGHISGIAPGASVIMYRVCGASTGCYTTDSVDAVEQAIMDDVDVLNFSIGGGASAYSDAVELAFLDAYAAGILVNASAGNSGPGPATTEHGGPWTNTVGASTLNRGFATTLHMTATGGPSPLTLDVPGVTVSGGVGSTPVVLGSATVSGLQCTTPAGGGAYTGKVVVCQRGTNARIEKGYNVSLGGAAGMILYNTASTDLETDNHFVPAVHVNDPSSTIAAFVTAHTGVMAHWSNGVPSAAQGDVMASFSSRGPLGDFIKPDVTAPGVQILAGNSPKHLFDPAGGLGPDDQLYQAIAGTSMSSPHAAGVAALMKAAHPSWTPGQIKSAMMTSSVQSVVKEDGSTPSDPFDRGAGSIRANRAANPTVTFDVTAPQYFASSSDPFSRINLNLPSINAPNMPGQISTTRTARNVTGVSQTIKITASANITVTPSTITLGPWGTASFSVKIDGQKQAEGQYFGKITLDPVKAGYNNAVLPVAWYKQPGDVLLTNECTTPTFVAQSLTIDKGTTVDCSVSLANYNSNTAHVQVRVNAPNTGRLIIKNWSAGNKKGNGFLWNGTLDPALAPEIEDISSPGYGYLSLPGLGVPPQSGFDDEDALLYTGLPAFSYGHELYDSMLIDPNGYVVIGSDGSSADNNCCDPSMPDPTKPNNVLAPYWTDLDPGSGGDIYFAEIWFGGPVFYLVIEWHEVPVYGTANARTFQIWIAEDGIPEDIAFEYCVAPNAALYPADGCDDAAPALLGPGAPDGLLVGAENRDGSSAATIGPLDTQPSNLGYVITAGSPTAGGTMEIDYQAFGKKTGNFDVKAKMTSDVTQGTDFQIVKIHVVNAP